ncbi:conserved Plasmodium protein, unknown function [Plasmodium gallinaceum]|uniref:RlmI-like PUA domain-containing protein n=1 Tax=Plasmodium gallinaceum TaxID=5849 RepID=A0A1J1GR37_PLAGA|nr:conserved Plasmodium protein, unknown function [Plasmodium gallinaceum]CRG94977.1 conserved Plasmodium protein, unknown function [Plasmodium gallinaceum]
MFKIIDKIKPNIFLQNVKINNTNKFFFPQKNNKLRFSSKVDNVKFNADDNISTNFLEEQELKLIFNKKVTFSSIFEDRINVFLKPLETDVICEGRFNCNNLIDRGNSIIIDDKKNDINKLSDDNNKELNELHNENPNKNDLKENNNNNNNNNENKKNNLKFLSFDRYNLLSKGKHMYIYDFEIYNISELSKYDAGEIVNVYFYNKEKIGIGLLNRKSNIVIRIIERDISKVIDDRFFIKKLYESIKRRFKFIYNINLYDYIYSFNVRNNTKIFCKIVNSVNDELPGLVVYVFDKSIYIRYDNLIIQKYNYIFEKELEKIFSPKNMYSKKIISKKEKRAQKGKEYILEQLKGDDLELNYCENNYTFYNNITNISYHIFDIESKYDRVFLQSLSYSSNILNIDGNVGEYIINTSLKNQTYINNYDCRENISIILSDSAKNTNYINKNISINNCKHITSLHRENILEELNNMSLNNLKFDLIIYNTKSNITYRKNSYTSIYGKRYTVTFKGIHKYLNYISDILQKNGLLFITVELSTSDYHKFLNIVKCVFENKKKSISIVYENSCSIENNILCIDENAWYMRSVCFKLGES